MSRDETILQSQEVGGVAVVVCDLCGRPGARWLVERRAGQPAIAEPIEAIRLCRDCWLTIEHDETPFDEEIGAGLQSADE